MKTFKDLKFKKHRSFTNGKMASLNFDNGFGVSVINGEGAYAGVGTWEVAILYNDLLCYTSGITEDVIGWQTPRQVTSVMKQVQSLIA